MSNSATIANVSDEAVDETCLSILRLLLPHCRTSDSVHDVPLEAFRQQLHQLREFVAVGDPVLFTLPAFPCKSPNPAKVLGRLPDEGERLSLWFLEKLCRDVAEIYEPGARVLICSDGHVFGDLIGVSDPDIDSYGAALSAMIRNERLSCIDTFSLQDVFGDISYDEKRELIHQDYAPSVEALRERIQTDGTTLQLYRGITRFLVEDTADFAGTRSALQRQCRQRAYGVIQRSRAWGEIIAEYHPRSVRLSIHPQPVGASKFGIRLLAAGNVWLTPWHSCVVHRIDNTWELVQRSKVEDGNVLMTRNGTPSHFEAPYELVSMA